MIRREGNPMPGSPKGGKGFSDGPLGKGKKDSQIGEN